jgi:hypothetical protein
VRRAEERTRTESLDFRGSQGLRDDAASYGDARGLTLSSALAVLVECGLDAAGNQSSVRNLERKVQRLEKELAVYQERDHNWRVLCESLQGHLPTLRVGKCPECYRHVTAFDYFLARQCPRRNAALAHVAQATEDSLQP